MDCKISVIIPAYNAEKYISETMDSVLAQTYRNIEVIVINDGSTDSTEEIINGFEDDRIKYYKQDNSGQSAARNRGLGLACGEYISFVDADDVLDRECLEKLLCAAREKDADISVCGYEKFYDDTGEVFYKRIPRDWEVEFDHEIKHVFIYSPWAKLYKTEFVRKYDLKFSEGEQLEDGPFSCLAHLLAKEVALVNYIGLRYRTYNGSTMGNVRRKNSRPSPPYKGVRLMIDNFNAYNDNEYKRKVMEYCAVKILAGFTTNMYKNVDAQSRREICTYCHDMMREYFWDIRKNEYIRIGRLKTLPLSHRVAVRLFVFFDGLNLLYPFSVVVSKVL